MVLMEYRKELLRHVQPGEQVGIRLAHHALSEATQSSLSAFHNAGLGSGTTSRMSPSLQQIMDGVITNSNTSMIIKTNDRTKNAIPYRTLRYYVSDVTNSIVDVSLNGKDLFHSVWRVAARTHITSPSRPSPPNQPSGSHHERKPSAQPVEVRRRCRQRLAHHSQQLCCRDHGAPGLGHADHRHADRKSVV